MVRAKKILEELKRKGYFNDRELVPKPPKITKRKVNSCRKKEDFRPVLMEWYRFVGLLCVLFTTTRRDSPGFKDIERQEHQVLVGLLHRCTRLMLANIALAHEGAFGETTAIIDRCIFESVVKIIWLARTTDRLRFRRFIADGLKTELEFTELIETAMAARGGEAQNIEKRMLASIEYYIASSGMSADAIRDTKKLPDLASMIEAVWGDRLFYVVGQRLGSHHIHGTWVSLRMHYLDEQEGGELVPRDHNCQTHVNQIVFIAIMVLSALSAFVSYVLIDSEEKNLLLEVFEAVRKEIDAIYVEVIGNDFELAGNAS
jgi:hypothetical protein